ncbi:DUF6188 family protein [Nocardioides ferulae]|uniref:DUF6188 family protein n=1 Tax=Nocardioides ferulae TaxID=2340821 RepID=UPI000EAD7BFA|nr:DUF6188 family protein [Nocardioides ferulae]
MTPTLVGQTLARVELSYYLDLITEEGAVLRMEDEYALSVGDQRWSTANGDQEQIAAQLQTLIGLPITEFEPTPDGGLVCVVRDARVTAAPSAAFESWSLVGPSKERIVSGPGGELTVWSID